jgi:hypothetical protein
MWCRYCVSFMFAACFELINIDITHLNIYLFPLLLDDKKEIWNQYCYSILVSLTNKNKEHKLTSLWVNNIRGLIVVCLLSWLFCFLAFRVVDCCVLFVYTTATIFTKRRWDAKKQKREDNIFTSALTSRTHFSSTNSLHISSTPRRWCIWGDRWVGRGVGCVRGAFWSMPPVRCKWKKEKVSNRKVPGK